MDRDIHTFTCSYTCWEQGLSGHIWAKYLTFLVKEGGGGYILILPPNVRLASLSPSCPVCTTVHNDEKPQAPHNNMEMAKLS